MAVLQSRGVNPGTPVGAGAWWGRGANATENQLLLDVEIPHKEDREERRYQATLFPSPCSLLPVPLLAQRRQKSEDTGGWEVYPETQSREKGQTLGLRANKQTPSTHTEKHLYILKHRGSILLALVIVTVNNKIQQPEGIGSQQEKCVCGKPTFHQSHTSIISPGVATTWRESPEIRVPDVLLIKATSLSMKT